MLEEKTMEKKEPRTFTGYVKAFMLNVREKPTSLGKVVQVVNQNDKLIFDKLYSGKGWYKVLKPVKGYVMSQYIAKGERDE